MSPRAQALLWGAQRASAALLAICVVVHLTTVIYAVQNGLSAAEILGRTRGNPAWLLFYVVFVTAVAVHAPIGLDIGAETAPEIAVSILAQMIAVRRGAAAIPAPPPSLPQAAAAVR